MGKFVDLTGRRFGRLVVLSRVKSKRVKWLCKCDCGNIVIIRSDTLKNGETKSCGCLRGEVKRERCKRFPLNLKHKQTNTRLYHIWCSMKQRVENPNSKEHKNYGKRGITICYEWKDSFEKFYLWAISNGYKEDLTIDRIDNNGNYCPNNCRWISIKGNCNNKRNCHYITIGNVTKTLKQWTETIGIKYSTVQTRIRRGWNEIDALYTPVNNIHDKRHP